MPQANKVAERLLAHARLYRKMAGASCNEDTAVELEQQAVICLREAAEAGAGDAPQDPGQISTVTISLRRPNN
jgi:hypothetical protein